MAMQNDLAKLFQESCQKYAALPAFSCLGHTLTFEEVGQQAQAFAAWLQRHTDLEVGDRIAIQLPNILQYPVAAYGSLLAGLVLVNTNPMYTPREMRHQFIDSDAKAVVILGDLLPNLDKIIADTEIRTVIVTDPLDLSGGPARSLSNKIHVGMQQVLAEGAKLCCNVVYTDNPEQLAILQYTGGTTGPSKGAMLSHGNVTENVNQMMDSIGVRCREGEEIFIAPLPLYHIYAFNLNMVMFFSRGSLNVLIPNPRDIDSFVKTMAAYPFTAFAGLNTLFVGLCSHPDFAKLDFSQLALTCSGGTALTEAAAKLWQDTTGCVISEGYGLSETSPVVTFNPVDGERLGFCGIALSRTEIKMVDALGQEVPQGEPGELWVRGPQVMQGYWKRPDATAEAMEDGFFKTGDIARFDELGYIQIVDRKKDMVIVSGFNVFPNEVENVLALHPTILECAVVGVPDEQTGEAVRAYVVLKPGVTPDKAGLIDYCREQLTAYKVPKQVEFIAELPKSTVGKTLRNKLRQQATA
ncbi:AMP-binding protein [Ferrimonas lipolytica]|uniref:Long-chain-fatty-acid--CoA ligase n=1 Tax=Ferrimonas lipolytica TaxID=2724191 RepID=A0A6H1UGF6_9GAMM|nr:AMP-binding protein [Ferrimonas lipolytica]QIZ77296.1 AMP-binding protein [Ferrimonas lipolytica]